jgi:cell division protein FtsI/penicillin-binding protein 2
MSQRINFVLVLFILFSAVLIYRLFYLQILQGEFYLALAKGQRTSFQEIKGDRGKIFFEDKEGNLYPAAINKDITYVYICPKEIEEKATSVPQNGTSASQVEKTAEFLSEKLAIEKKEIIDLINRDSLFELIDNNVGEKIAEEIKSQKLKGVYLGQRKSRFYPFETMASKILGFVDADSDGNYGIEGYYNEVLRGQEGFSEEERGMGGKIIFFNSESFKTSEAGIDLVSTIDYNIQYQAEKILGKTIEQTESESGLIVVLNPQNGEIKALANSPNFNPNLYFQEEMKIFQNDVVQKIFEPGSVFKPFTMAAGLDLGKVKPDTKYTDNGVLKFKGGVIYNYSNRTYGEQTMTNVLEKSINTGAVFVEQAIGEKNFIDYIKKYGFEELTSVDLVGEVFSKNKNLETGRDINLATAAFGQGVELTPIQVLQGFSALVNGGTIWKPHIVKKVINQNNEEKTIEPELRKSDVIKKETSEKLVEMLVSVVENGFGKKARVNGHYIGGKTGTAQVPWTALGIEKAGYSDKTVQSFIGFFPAYKPQFLIMVKLDNPNTKTAEYSAIPAFHELAEYIINYYQIAPEY